MAKKKMDLNKRGIDVAVDFDGTCTTHDFPKVGKDIGAQKVLKRLLKNNHRLILFTMRSHGNYIDDAITWFNKNDIPLFGINTNPEQHTWTKSPKAYAQLFIDDASLGCPLKYDRNLSSRPFVDWDKVEELLENMELI